MQINFILNGAQIEIEVSPDATLLSVLRDKLGLYGVKHGCETGECGACTILLDGVPVNSCVMLAPQVDGRKVTTIESLGEHPDLGWRQSAGLDPIQQAFVETGAIQCGYCTPGLILSTKALLDINPNPDVNDIYEAISGNICRCTGYKKIINAIKLAAEDLQE